MYLAAIAFSVLCWLAVGFYFVRSPVSSAFHPFSFYFAFHGLLFVVRPVLGYFLDYQLIYRAYEFTPSMSDKLTVILASNLGFLVFAFACLRVGSVEMRFKEDAVISAERARLTPIFLWVGVFCAPLALASLLSTWSQASSGDLFQSMTLDRATGVQINNTGNGYFSDAQAMLASLCAIAAWLMGFRLYSVVPLLLFVVLRAGSGGRGMFVTAMVSLGLFWLYEHRRRFPTPRVLIALVIMVLAFRFVGDDRGRAVRLLVGTDYTRETSVKATLKPMEGMDFANMEYFEYLVYAIPQRTHTYGYYLDNLQVFTEPVPRVWWKGKPIGAPFNKIFLFDYGFPIGMTRSLPGEGWYSLGWLGVIITCGIWGTATGYYYRRYVLGPQTTIRTAVYMMVIPSLIVSFRDGVLVTVFRQLDFFLLPLVLWWLFARYIGVQDVATIRRALAQRVRREARLAVTAEAEAGLIGDAAPAAPTVPAPWHGVRSLAHLPAAVQRRRRALAQPKPGQT